MTMLAAKPQTPSRSPSGKPAHLTTYLSRPLSFSLSPSLSLTLSLSRFPSYAHTSSVCQHALRFGLIRFPFCYCTCFTLRFFYCPAPASLPLSLWLPAPLPHPADLPDEALQHFCIANVEIHWMPALYIDLRVAALSALTLQQPPVASAGILCH